MPSVQHQAQAATFSGAGTVTIRLLAVDGGVVCHWQDGDAAANPALPQRLVTDAAGDAANVRQVFAGTNVALRLAGSDSDDHVSGADRNDNIAGGGGQDELSGGGGDDTLGGDAGRDGLSGFLGNDLLRGGTGNDTLTGGEGRDTLDGEADQDWLHGGAGDDVLVGGPGDDVLTGGAGADTFRLHKGDQAAQELRDNPFAGDQITDFTSGPLAVGDVIELVGFDPAATLVRVNASRYEVMEGATVVGRFFVGNGAVLQPGRDYVFVPAAPAPADGIPPPRVADAGLPPGGGAVAAGPDAPTDMPAPHDLARLLAAEEGPPPPEETLPPPDDALAVTEATWPVTEARCDGPEPVLASTDWVLA